MKTNLNFVHVAALTLVFIIVQHLEALLKVQHK